MGISQFVFECPKEIFLVYDLGVSTLVQVAIVVFALVKGTREVWVIKRYYLHYFGNNQLTKLRDVPCHVLGPLMMCHVTINFW